MSGLATVTTSNGPFVSAMPAGAPGGASCALGNNGAYGTANGFSVTLPSALGDQDFTLEFAVYQTAWSDPTDSQSDIVVSSITPPGGGTVAFPSFYSGAGVDHVVFSGAGMGYADNTSQLMHWERYAVSRLSGVIYLFRDGELLTSFDDSTAYADATFYVGRQSNGTYNAAMGSIGQIRVTTAGRYASKYTPCSGSFARSP